jgi:hypothetical protein
VQVDAAAAKPAATTTKSPQPGEEPNVGVFGQIQQDIEKASKILNPFAW